MNLCSKAWHSKAAVAAKHQVRVSLFVAGGTSGTVYVNAASLSFAAYPAGSTAAYRCQLEVLSDATSTYSVQSAFAACTSPQVQTTRQL